MSRLFSAFVPLLAIALAAAALGAGPAPAGSPDHVPQIAVVRMAQITRNCTEYKQLIQTLQARANDMNQEEGKRRTEITQMIEQLSQLKGGSAQWLGLRDQIDDKKLALEVWGEKMKLELDRRQKAGEKSLYDHITQAVQTVAENQHLDLVLSDNGPDLIGPDLDGITPSQFHQLLNARAVLFANKKADVTEDVLTLVESNFKNQKSEAASTVLPNPPAH
ncbi:MAG TPA: OmpH family outer membrane protein [Tepidisphaeraceae bacterium]|jgi:Skp family chaperone for outer membrane proteins|nr:OmpH family outer membrane protein [Tepidisphaeraceae bacterium]